MRSTLQVERFSTLESLLPLRAAWNELAGGVPFRGFEWLTNWWRTYAEPSSNLLALAVFDERNELVGLAPWYLGRSASGRVIRFLGSGEVCSDYLTVPCRESHRESVTRSLATWLNLVERSDSHDAGWDRIELGSIDSKDLAMASLIGGLEDSGSLVRRRNRSSCWRIHLPACWNDYLAMLSKSHRKQIRRLERKYIETRRAAIHVVETPRDLERGLDVLVRLHQRRRRSLGDRGCFASARFAAFHRATAGQLLANGQLRLTWLELDGRPVAVEYQLLGHNTVYAYQSGIEPDVLAHEPGLLITLATVKQAIGEGRAAFDFLRGDESYKAHWRAQPLGTQDIQIVSNRLQARMRHNLWLAGGTMKRWVKTLSLSNMTMRGYLTKGSPEKLL